MGNLLHLRLLVTQFVATFTFALVLAGATPTLAQTSSTGIIVGSVIDPSGAVIPKAAIVARELTTGVERVTVSTGNGQYVISDVPPGVYTVTATCPGFKKSVISSVTVAVATQVTANFKMQIGASTTLVQVTASNEDLQTLNATVGETVEPVMVESLPSIGRDASTFADLQPGVSPTGNVAGTVQDQAVFQLDGGSNSSDMDGSMESYTGSFANTTTGGFMGSGASGVMPMPQDSVEEFKVSTSGQTADFNNSSGLQAQVVTKRGRDKWNGTIYEYYLDSNFGANSWQNNFPAPLHTAKPDYHYSRFGIAGGGPVAPKIWGGKTYLFANFEGFRYPNAQTFEHAVPSAAFLSGQLTFGGTTYSAATLTADDPRKIGQDQTLLAMYKQYLPQQGNTYPGGTFDPSCGGLSSSYCDTVNTIAYKANIAIPEHSNFGVVRLDHDFSEKWHFMASYRYYNLQNLTTNQVDIGGYFPGDKLGLPVATADRPQLPMYLVAGLTTNISPTFTNDFHYSFLRNFWQWKDDSDPAQVTGAAGAVEPGGEGGAITEDLTPYNVDAQNTRTRIWDGQDNYFRDDLTKIAGGHLIQFGAQFMHNFNYHQRTDNGGGINYTTTYQIGDSSGGGTIAYTGLSAAGLPTGNTTDARIMDEYYGFVTDTQVADTYKAASGTLSLNPPLTPVSADTTIPYYNFYATDTWHTKSSVTVNYGLSYAIEMPPHERSGAQVMWVDQNDNPISAMNYLAQRESQAEAGQSYNPITGYALIKNVANGHQQYLYNPFYGALSPRISASWSPSGKSGFLKDLFGDKATVIRGGYGRIYGRLNGVIQVLSPLLSPGLIFAVQCAHAQSPTTGSGTCGASTTDTNAFRFGTAAAGEDGLSAPLANALSTLPQPYFPGVSGPSGAVGSPLDPSLRPNDVDTFNFSIERQVNRKMMVEVGYVGRLIHHELTDVNPNQVPYMYTYGGQSFVSAYDAIEGAFGCTQSNSLCQATYTAANSTSPKSWPIVPAQPFFEAALGGVNSAYCTGYPSCTAAVVAKQASNFVNQRVFTIWSALDDGPFVFPRTMWQTPIPGQNYGANGQLTSGLTVSVPNAWGNYNGGYISFKTTAFHGVTAQENLTWSKALGLNAFAQSTSEAVVNDSFDLKKNYGVQSFDQKLVFNTFIVYEIPWYRNQTGIVGRLAGGWTISPVIAAGTGVPRLCTTNSGNQSFGGADGVNIGDEENCVFTQGYNGGYHTHYGIAGGTDPNGIAVGTAVKEAGVPAAEINVFSNPVAVYDSARPPILGLDEHGGGDGVIRGLPYMNMDLSVKKRILVRESESIELSGVFFNVMNHLDFSNESLSLSTPTSWGTTRTQGNTPRMIQIGIRANF